MKLERFNSLIKEYGKDALPTKGTCILVHPPNSVFDWVTCIVTDIDHYLDIGEEEIFPFIDSQRFYIP